MEDPTFTDYFSNIQNQVGPRITDLITHPSLMNPYTALMTAWLLSFILELALPKKKAYSVLGRKGFWLDIFYLFFIDFLFSVIGFVALTATVEHFFLKGMDALGVKLPLVSFGNFPFIVQFLIFFVIYDFVQFFAHYLEHRIEFLWKFHKIHHAQETLGFASTRHFHFGEYLILRPLGWIPFGLLGFSDEKYILCTAIYMWIAYFLVFFSHANVKVNFGILNKIIITPNTHYWHHSKNLPRKYGVNYASVLTVWDFLFGSFYLPNDPKLEPILGIPDNDVPKHFIGQMWYPFASLFSKKKERQSNLRELQEKKKK